MNKLQEEFKRMRKLSGVLKEQMNYDSFSDFLNSEYGLELADQEIAQAIIEWAQNYVSKLNRGDFEIVSKYINDTIYDLIKYEAPKAYLDKLLKFYKHGKK